MKLFSWETFNESYFDAMRLIVASFFGAKISTYIGQDFLPQILNLLVSLAVALVLIYVINRLEDYIRQHN